MGQMATLSVLTGDFVETRSVQQTGEKLQPNDGVDDDDKQDEEGDVQQWDHGHQDGVQHNLQTCEKREKDIEFRQEILWLAWHVYYLSIFLFSSL